MPVNLRVIDISHHNTITSFEQIRGSGIVGVIHKASQGTSMVDAKYAGRRQQAMDAGLLWGAYHFADGSDAQAQLEHFLETAALEARDLGALDYEDYPRSQMDMDGVRAFLTAYEAARGTKAVLYSGNRIKEDAPDEDEFLTAHRLWLAQYGPAPKIPALWGDKIFLWQYSDGTAGPTPRRVPGVTGNVDCNSFNGSDDELRAQWPG